HHVGQCERDQGAVGYRVQPILDQHRLHGGVLDHVFVVDEAHLRHATTGVTGLEIPLEEPVLLRRRPGSADFHRDVLIRLENAAKALGNLELPGNNPDALAGGAAVAGGSVDEV